MSALKSTGIRPDGHSLCATMGTCSRSGHWEVAEAMMNLQVRSENWIKGCKLGSDLIPM